MTTVNCYLEQCIHCKNNKRAIGATDFCPNCGAKKLLELIHNISHFEEYKT